MQPYFLPYIGYFQLIRSVDQFVIYDNIKYTKKGWINRNRFLRNGEDKMFSIALESGSDSLEVSQRLIARSFDREKLVRQFASAYGKAPFFKLAFPVVEQLVCNDSSNLFAYIFSSVKSVCSYLGIETEIVVSSSQNIDHTLSGKERVIAICKYASATHYINSIGGQELYDRNEFQSHGLALNFLKSRPFVYPQFGSDFVPWLSIIDVMMFSPVEDIQAYLANGYDFV